jgi:ferrochelatase
MRPQPYDALLLISFGGPEGPDDVLPFLQRVTRGRAIPPERLAEVAQHYLDFGGTSPINAQNRELLAALQKDLADHGWDLPVYWGNRNWHPFLGATLRAMAGDGVRRAIAFVTSAYASYSSCRQYREDIATAQADVGHDAPQVDKLRHYFNHPGFVEPMIRNTVDAIAELDPGQAAGAHLAFVTHSIPTSMNETSGPGGEAYVAQHLEAARLIAEGVAARTGRSCAWELAYCSRSGPPNQPWLEPDITDHLDMLKKQGAAAAVMVPIGFVSDHMEVRYDLDHEAASHAAEIGLPTTRAATVGADPQFVAMIRELVSERISGPAAGERPALGGLGPSHDICPAGCCPNPRGPRPAAAGGAGGAGGAGRD